MRWCAGEGGLPTTVSSAGGRRGHGSMSASAGRSVSINSRTRSTWASRRPPRAPWSRAAGSDDQPPAAGESEVGDGGSFLTSHRAILRFGDRQPAVAGEPKPTKAKALE